MTLHLAKTFICDCGQCISHNKMPITAEVERRAEGLLKAGLSFAQTLEELTSHIKETEE